MRQRILIMIAAVVAVLSLAGATTASATPGSANGDKRLGSIAADYCPEGAFCITANGEWLIFRTCTRVPLVDWWGPVRFYNNQAPGTVARAYSANGFEIWRNTAKSTGTIDTTPWYYFRPC